MRLFRTNDISVVNCYQLMFQVDIPGDMIRRRLGKFKIIKSDDDNSRFYLLRYVCFVLFS